MKIIAFLLLTIIVGTGSFIFGLHWQGTLSQNKLSTNSITQLSCFGSNNFSETYQLDCYSPLNNTDFKYQTSLPCHVLTNHQLDNSKPHYNVLTTIKANEKSFILDINEGNKVLQKSRGAGEMSYGPFTIIVNDDYIIQAIRKTKLDDFFGNVYEYLTLSKKTGKGMTVWSNQEQGNRDQDSIASFFFQCD